MTGSKTYVLNKEDALKILKGAGIAAGGALVAYLLNVLPSVEFGASAYIAVPLLSVLLNAALKFFKNNTKE